MYLKKSFLVFFCFLLGFLWADSIEVYFGPNGGFSTNNKNRVLTMADGTQVPGTLSTSLVQMLEQAEPGGQMKICMYSMGDPRILSAMIQATQEKNITVKLILDACSPHTAEGAKNIVKKVQEARELAKKDGKNFDFQIKWIETATMTARGRTKTLNDGTVIYGTMHEKFGVFYRKGSAIPFDCFAGSANASKGADQIYAESRLYFRDRPAVARQFQEEFARLWNEFGTPVEGFCVSEKLIPVDPSPGDVQVIFNSEPLSENAYHSIDEALKKIINEVSFEGSLDLAMFSFTHYELARTIMDCARRNPKAKFRIMMDQTMLANTEDRQGVMGPWLDQQIKRQKLKNVEIRYKWRSNAYGWDEEKQRVDILHSENQLLHHKLMIVNRSVMVNGSFNWSDSAEERNFENLMIFRRPYPGHGALLDRYLDEFDTLWNTLKEEGVATQPRPKQPQMIHFDRAVALSQKILELLKDEKNREILALFKQEPFLTVEDIFLFIPVSEKELESRLNAMVEATILCYYVNEQKEQGYSKAD